MARPEKELKAFAKVELKPKQKKTITFTLDREAFWYFDTLRNAWTTEAGEHEIWVGGSSRDVREKRSILLEPEPRTSRLHTGLTVNSLLADADANRVLMKHTAGPLMMADLNTIGELTLDEVAVKFPEALPKSRMKQIEVELVKIK